MATSSRRKPAPVPRGGKAPQPKPAALPPRPSVPLAPPDERQQAELFDCAIKLFQSEDYAVARGLFETAGLGPNSVMAHSARLHAAMCVRRLGQREPALRTPEEHYNSAIALINQRRLADAEQHLTAALAAAPDADHVHYALALCCGLAGDLRAAYRHLRRAIEIAPRNRAAARSDPDFADISRLSPLFELLYPERTASDQPRR